MRKCLSVVVGLALLTSSSAFAQQPTLVVENGRVITGDGTVHEQASVAVAGDSILSVTRQPVEAPEARRIDASGKTVLPGLIDAHVHLTVPPGEKDSTALTAHLREAVPAVLTDFLEHGITTVRSPGGYWPWVGQLRDRIAAGKLPGPRMITSGPILTARGGAPAAVICQEDLFCRSHLAGEIGGPEQARMEVRELAEEGVDCIKLLSDSVNYPVPIEDEVVEAVIDEAHRESLKAVGHVALDEDMVRYARMGMDGFVHVPRELPSRHSPKRLAHSLAKHCTPVTTTISASLYRTDKPVQGVLGGESVLRDRIAVQSEHVAILAEAGVPIVVGSDWCPCFPNTSGSSVHPAIQPGAVTITEMQMLRRGGMSRQAIVQAATANAARALKMVEKVGNLAAGKLADLIVVDGNPLADLSALEDVEVVVQGGEVVAGAASTEPE